MSKKKILIPLIIFSTVLTTCSVYIYQMLYSPNFLINSDEKFIVINEKTEFNQLIKNFDENVSNHIQTLMKLPILIFDEATSSVDNETELLLQKALHEISKDRTTIVEISSPNSQLKF